MGLCDEILEIDERIRFVAHLDKRMKKVIEMKHRHGVNPLTEESHDTELFFEIGPSFLETAKRFEEFLGELINVRLSYEKVTIIFLKIPEAVLGLSIESGPVTSVVEKVAERFKIVSE